MESKKTPPFSKNVLGKPLGISSSQSTTKKPPASKIQPNLPKSTIKKVPRGSTASNGSTSSDSSNIDPSVKEEKRASLILLQSEFMRVKAQNELDDTKNHMEQEVRVSRSPFFYVSKRFISILLGFSNVSSFDARKAETELHPTRNQNY